MQICRSAFFQIWNIIVNLAIGGGGGEGQNNEIPPSPLKDSNSPLNRILNTHLMPSNIIHSESTQLHVIHRVDIPPSSVNSTKWRTRHYVLHKLTQRSFLIQKTSFSIISHCTAFTAVYQCYLCICLIAETDMISARFIQYKMQADCLLNPPILSMYSMVTKKND